MNTERSKSLMTTVYPRWSDRGIGEQDASRWVRVLRAYAMIDVVDILGERSSSQWMDWALVSACLSHGEHSDAREVRRWLDSGIPVERVEAYLPAGLNVEEAQMIERSGSFYVESLLLLSALRLESEQEPDRRCDRTTARDC